MDPAVSARERGLLIFRATFVPAPALDQRGVNVTAVRQRLGALGEILGATPTVRGKGSIVFEFVVGLREQPGDVDSWEKDGVKFAAVTEEAPAPAIDAAARAKIGKVVVDAIKAIGYLGVGTIEFLYENGEFFFIEMNTRLQVEHPVTEAITGIDLVREQIRIAAGLPLSFTQAEVVFEGHAIECRINAENPKTFAPSPGLVTDYHAPGGLGVRMDSALYAGYTIPPYYDSLIGKLIVHRRDRAECIARLNRCLGEIVVAGIDTNIPLFQELLAQSDIMTGDYNIHWLENWMKSQAAAS